MLISVCVGSVRGNTVGHLAASLLEQTWRDWELLIIAQGDDPGLRDAMGRLADMDPRIRCRHVEFTGKCRALNEAVNMARGDVVAITDDDCEAAPDWLAVIAECFLRDPTVGIVAGDVLPAAADGRRISVCPATRTIECVYRPKAAPDGAPPGFYYGGANLAMLRTTIEAVGPFDEVLGPGAPFRAAEDVDFGLRAEVAGIAVHTTPRSVVVHTHGRRYGVRAALRLRRDYAYGGGALGAKLRLCEHRLDNVWNAPRGGAAIVGSVVRNPVRGTLAIFEGQYRRMGFRDYLRGYSIDNRSVSVPRAPTEAKA